MGNKKYINKKQTCSYFSLTETGLLPTDKIPLLLRAKHIIATQHITTSIAKKSNITASKQNFSEE